MESCGKYWVIGGYETHNNWPDYKLLFTGISDLSKKSVLDFGCGPGRNLVTRIGYFSRPTCQLPAGSRRNNVWRANNLARHVRLGLIRLDSISG